MNAAARFADHDFEAYRRDVFAWAYRLLGNDHDCDDVVQDVFLRWDRQCRSAMPASPRGWLRRVTLNRALDVFRGRPPQQLTAQAESCPTSVEIAGNLDLEQLRQDVAAALEEVTDIQRSVIVAKVYDGLTFAEIAADHDLAVSTVKTHYLRAVRGLARRLQARWADSDDAPARRTPEGSMP